MTDRPTEGLSGVFDEVLEAAFDAGSRWERKTALSPRSRLKPSDKRELVEQELPIVRGRPTEGETR